MKKYAKVYFLAILLTLAGALLFIDGLFCEEDKEDKIEVIAPNEASQYAPTEESQESSEDNPLAANAILSEAVPYFPES